jgi:hypothetical protein
VGCRRECLDGKTRLRGLLGVRPWGWNSAELVFEDYRLSKDHLIGGEGKASFRRPAASSSGAST